MYTGDLVSSLMAKSAAVLKQNVSTTGNPFDDLCEVKTALADTMAKQIEEQGRESEECKQLWKEADKLQAQVIKETKL